MVRTGRGTLVAFVLLAAFAGCGNLTCDQQKQESIKHMNAGVEAANTQSFSTAQRELEQALVLDPTNHQAAYQLGLVYIKQEKWDKAVDALTAAVKYNDKDPMYHYHLGHSYLETQKLDMARTELERAVSLNKRLFKAHYYLGRVHAMQDRPRDAAVEWSEACRLNPGFGKPFYELGKLYYNWDYFQEAIQVLVQGAQYSRDPEDTSDVYYQLGLAYDAQKQYDKAVDSFLKSLENKKDNLDARLQLGFAYANQGDKPNAISYLEEFIKTATGNAQYAFAVTAANDRLLKLRSQ